jgi:hypothetical protein
MAVADNYNQKPQLLTYLINFIILGATFFSSCSIFAINSHGNLLLQSLIFAIVVLAGMKIGRQLVATTSLAGGRIQYTVLVNATGIVIGAISFFVMAYIVPNMEVSLIAIVVSSVIAFFILGTISPLFLFDRRMSAR